MCELLKPWSPFFTLFLLLTSRYNKILTDRFFLSGGWEGRHKKTCVSSEETLAALPNERRENSTTWVVI